MGFEDYVSETEAASRAGVSPRTLQRFSEAGYLHVEIEPDGLRLYARKELDEIFGHQSSSPTILPAFQEQLESIAAELPEVVVDEQQNVERDPLRISEPYSESANSDVTSQLTDLFGSSKDAQAGKEFAQPRNVEQISVSVAAVAPASSGADDSSREEESLIVLQREITRLKNLMHNQMTVLDGKDSEVRELKSQRDWLRTRVERLEEKGERDQILLLSETQTIRRLITIQEQKKSAVKQLLEWLGVSPSITKPMTTTDIIKSSEIVSSHTPSQEKPADSKSVGNG